MNDQTPHDRDHDLGERMERAVGGLRAPDVLSGAIEGGRRQRTRRRLALGAGGVAAATVLALTAQAFAGDRPGREQDPSAPSVASDPAAVSPPATTADDSCDDSVTGWWSKSTAQIRDDLAALLPDGVTIGVTNDRGAGTWGGNLTSVGDDDFASLRLLPPPGTPLPKGVRGPDLAPGEGGRCAVAHNEAGQAVKPCDELTGHVACAEVRSPDGTQVGVVTTKVEQTIVNGQEQPTDRTYVVATIAGPVGGHVELYVAEGTRADRPDTVHDPSDVPVLSMGQAQDIATDPVWTS